MQIAVDVMGGDNAPTCNVRGVLQALTDFPQIRTFLLVGDSEIMKRELDQLQLDFDTSRLELVHASQTITMSDPSATALRQKKDSSITVAAELLKDRRADALVSAGHTGAAVAATVVKTRTLEGIERPGIAAVMPTATGGSFMVLDVGANVDCKPIHLAQYALLGEAYSRDILRTPEPRVGVLSFGGEEQKGNDLTKNAFKLLKQMPINFIGNIEGHHLFTNDVDVIVCDGFVGNAMLKACESMARTISEILKNRLRKSPVRLAGAFLSKNAFRELKELTDHEEYGGAPLLGINGNCIIAHGSSTPKAVRNAIRVAMEMVDNRVNEHIMAKVSSIDWQELAAD
ncbi:MAG: phosphate acyltransferase PlsX [Lentisphaeria bacterium]|jgi:glycerol-3-phosphate acyltransferase PlsX|nr:phosphate acyltransferase PlsX [Lentisphaeria bacterium]